MTEYWYFTWKSGDKYGESVIWSTEQEGFLVFRAKASVMLLFPNLSEDAIILYSCKISKEEYEKFTEEHEEFNKPLFF